MAPRRCAAAHSDILVVFSWVGVRDWVSTSSAVAEYASAVRGGLAQLRDVYGLRNGTEPQNRLRDWF